MNFDGHFVTSESGWPSNVAPCLRTSITISRPSRNGSGHLADVADRHAGAAALRSSTRNVCVGARCSQLPFATLPVSW